MRKKANRPDPSNPLDRMALKIFSQGLGVVVKGPRRRPGETDGSRALRGMGIEPRQEDQPKPRPIPSDIKAELAKLKIREAAVLAAFNSLMVPVGWQEDFGDLRAAKKLRDGCPGIRKRIEALASEIERAVLPVLIRKLDFEEPQIEALPKVLRALSHCLNSQEIKSYLGEQSKLSPGKGSNFRTQLRDARIAILCKFFRSNTTNPRHALVAKIMEWQSGDTLSVDHIKAAERREQTTLSRMQARLSKPGI